MPVLQIRNVPDDVYRKLKDTAEHQRRSLSQQALVLLSAALEGTPDFAAERRQVLERIRAANIGRKFKLSDSVKFIRQDRDR